MEAAPSQAFHALRQVFDELGIFLDDARQLGGLAIVLAFELDDDGRATLATELEAAGLVLTEASEEALVRGPFRAPWQATLHVSLAHPGPDERIDVPAVPG